MKRFNSQFIKHKTNLIVILYLKALIYRKHNIATSSNELNVTRDCAIRRLVGFADQNLELFDSFFLHSQQSYSVFDTNRRQAINLTSHVIVLFADLLASLIRTSNSFDSFFLHSYQSYSVFDTDRPVNGVLIPENEPESSAEVSFPVPVDGSIRVEDTVELL